jgi:DNA-binding transcriptional LysR family regulator
MNNLSQLKSITALAQHKHFGRAANAIGMTQSALSQNIAKVEELLDVPLFERRNKQVSLTSYGEVVHKYALQMLDARNKASEEVQRLQNLETGILNIGIDPYFANSLLAPTLANLLTSHPQLKFTVRTIDWGTAEKLLLHRQVDLYIGMAPAHQHQSLHYLFHEAPTPLIVAKPDHPLASRSTVSVVEAFGYPVISQKPPDWYIDWVQARVTNLANRDAVQQLSFLQADNIEMAKTIVRHSLGLTAALPGDVREELARKTLISLALEDWPITMQGCIVYHLDQAQSPAAKMLITEYESRLVDECRERQDY